MLNPSDLFVPNLANFGEISKAFPIGAALVALVVGVMVGMSFWRQFKVQAKMVELETRRAQSDFDLVSRDIFRARQEVTSELASRNLKL